MRRALIAALVLLAAAPVAGQGFTMRFSGDILVPPGTVHEGTAITMNGRIQVDGTLNGDAMTMNGDILVSGTVRGSVRAFNGNVTLADTAVIEGDVWSANGRVDRRPGSQVRGRVQTSVGTPPESPSAPGSPPPVASRRWDGRWSWWWPGMMRAMATWTFVSFVALAAIASALFPLQVRRIADILHRMPGESVLAGFVLWIALPPLAVVLALSIVGIPVVAFLPFGVMVLGLAGVAGASQLIGDRVLGGFQQQHHTALEAVVGAALLGVLAFIPGLGWFAILLAVTWGIGGVLLLILRRVRNPAVRKDLTGPPPG